MNASNERFVCIHGHFYQPPRENPWLEAIEFQESAYPFHDWNERITTECYEPNMASRILDAQGNIKEIVNNYTQMSFNFGPTLLSWMEKKVPDVYDAILVADHESRTLRSGHGSALAQGYNHSILPLCNARDLETQVLWGIEDFQTRFERAPEGIWLPETAVNFNVLEMLATHGIKFTILAPQQAAAARRIGGTKWKELSNGSIDPSMAYQVHLPSGKTMSLFFYDGPIAHSVAFEHLLSNGENFANRLLSAFSDGRSWTQLVHIATDGETFGHHHRYGEMALSYALDTIESRKLARITNYGEFLEKFPPTHEIQLRENTSWSCFHGIERWKSDCGCSTGAPGGWNQAWRAPLREALDWLRDTVAGPFEREGSALFKNVWEARNGYIKVILDRRPETFNKFLEAHASRELNAEERTRAIKMMELQRNAQLMYTSCGWFFNDLTNIETVQVLQYAGRTLQLATELFGNVFEEEFLNRLAQAKSNIASAGDGRQVFETSVRPAMVTLEKVGAHYVLTSLFQTYEEITDIYCYTVNCDSYQLLTEGKARLAVGRATITSAITFESKRLIFAALYLGDHNLTGATQEFHSEEHYKKVVTTLTDAFRHGDLPAFFRHVDANFKSGTYTLKALFKDEQRTILNLLLEGTLKEAEAMYSQLYEHHAPLMRFLEELNMPLPRAFSTAAEFALNMQLREAFEADQPDLERIAVLLEEAKRSRINLDTEGLSFSLGITINRIAESVESDPDFLPSLILLERLVDMAATPPLKVNFWKAQNIYLALLRSHLKAYEERAKEDETAQRWVHHMQALGEKLRVKV